jgi:hypothetical protein
MQKLPSREEGYLPVERKPGKGVSSLQCRRSNYLYAVASMRDALQSVGPGFDSPSLKSDNSAVRVADKCRFESCPQLRIGFSSIGKNAILLIWRKEVHRFFKNGDRGNKSRDIFPGPGAVGAKNLR